MIYHHHCHRHCPTFSVFKTVTQLPFIFNWHPDILPDMTFFLHLLRLLTVPFFFVFCFFVSYLQCHLLPRGVELEERFVKMSQQENSSRDKRWSLQGMTALVTGGTKGLG